MPPRGHQRSLSTPVWLNSFRPQQQPAVPAAPQAAVTSTRSAAPAAEPPCEPPVTQEVEPIASVVAPPTVMAPPSSLASASLQPPDSLFTDLDLDTPDSPVTKRTGREGLASAAPAPAATDPDQLVDVDLEPMNVAAPPKAAEPAKRHMRRASAPAGFANLREKLGLSEKRLSARRSDAEDEADELPKSGAKSPRSVVGADGKNGDSALDKLKSWWDERSKKNAASGKVTNNKNAAMPMPKFLDEAFESTDSFNESPDTGFEDLRLVNDDI